MGMTCKHNGGVKPHKANENNPDEPTFKLFAIIAWTFMLNVLFYIFFKNVTRMIERMRNYFGRLNYWSRNHYIYNEKKGEWVCVQYNINGRMMMTNAEDVE